MAVVTALVLGGLPAVAAGAPVFGSPRLTDAGVDGPFELGYPVLNLDRSGGLDLVALGCANNQNNKPPAAPNTVACPDPQPTMSIVSGDGTGGFKVTQQIHAGSYPTDVTPGQFDKDALLDLAVTDPFGPQSTAPGQVLIYAQLPTAVNGELFRLKSTITLAGPQPKGVQSADLNGDKTPDLVVMESNPAGADVQVLLGDPSGNAAFRPLPAFAECTSGHFFKGFSDFNEDGKLDFAVPCVGDGKIAVMIGNGDGTFTTTYIPFTGLSMNVVSRDLNNDGHTDLVFSAVDQLTSTGRVGVELGDGKGNFVPAPGSPYQDGYTSGRQMTNFLDVADFGGPAGTGPDGRLDVAVTNASVNFKSASVSLLYGKGDGSLYNAGIEGSPFDLGAGTSFKTWGLVAGDWNGDGRPDVAAAGGSPTSAPGKLTLLESQLPPRVDVTAVTARVTPVRDRYLPYSFTVSGRVLVPAGVGASACQDGRVTVQWKAGGKTVSARRTSLKLPACSYRIPISFGDRRRLGAGRLTIQARFLGNERLKPAAARLLSARVG